MRRNGRSGNSVAERRPAQTEWNRFTRYIWNGRNQLMSSLYEHIEHIFPRRIVCHLRSCLALVALLLGIGPLGCAESLAATPGRSPIADSAVPEPLRVPSLTIN